MTGRGHVGGGPMNAPIILVGLLLVLPLAAACGHDDPPPVDPHGHDGPCVDVQPGRDPPVHVHDCDDPPRPAAP